MALWMVWATMASPIQLPLPALEISGVYKPFSSRFTFPVAFHCCNAGLTACIPYCPFTTWRLCTCARVGIY